MCTLTWVGHPDGFEVFFNRDELRTRRPGLPPAVGQHRGTAFVAPRDGDHGGTWLGVNEHGVAVALLNHYPPEPPEPVADPTSRGHLVIDMLDCQHAGAVASRLQTMSLAAYRPFFLAALDRAYPPIVRAWDGSELHRLSGEMPVTTSSFDTAAVVHNRRQVFARLRDEHGPPAADWLVEYHRSHEPARDAYAVCMHRPDAHTMSFSRIRVDARRVRFRYWPTAPCRMGEAAEVLLPVSVPG